MDSRVILLISAFLFCAVTCDGMRLPKRPFYLRNGKATPVSSGYSYKTMTFQQQVIISHTTPCAQSHAVLIFARIGRPF